MKTKKRPARIAIAKNKADVLRCYPVMRELRTHFTSAEKFARQVMREQRDGYLLAFLESDGEVRAVAGYRFLESLFSGKFLYVDDLVARDRDRSRGFGSELFDWLMIQARAHGCDDLQLDSGVQRFDAHRFYLVKRMKIASYHFSIPTNGRNQSEGSERSL